MRRYLRDPTFSRFDTIPECDGHTHTHKDGQTDRQTDKHTMTAYTALSKASRGKNGEHTTAHRGWNKGLTKGRPTANNIKALK